MGRKRRRKPYNKASRYISRKKRYRKDDRNWDSPEYVSWRKAVKARDGNMCQWPGCMKRSGLQVHHIKRWSKFPGLRYVLGNGITLCRKCHDSIKGKEEDFEAFFNKLLQWQIADRLRKFNKKD